MERMHDIAIIGAGPAGVAAAMSLIKKSGQRFKIGLYDKAAFPREKVCGDAVPYWVFSELEKVCSGILDRMEKQFNPTVFSQTRVITSNKKSTLIKWSKPGYMIPRIDLDQFLLDELRQMGDFELLEQVHIVRAIRRSNHFELIGKEGEILGTARYLIGADGAPSMISKSLQPLNRKKNFSGSAVRGYFTGLEIKDTETAVICLDKRFSPGYFWFFPLGPDRANLGFGMTNKQRQKKRINLHDAFWMIAEDHPEICRMLNSSHLEDAMKGGVLPFGRSVSHVVGEGYCLVGDAAYLNDPLSGDGIINAVISGIMAGEALSELPDTDELRICTIQSYQNNLKKRLHRSLKLRAMAVRLASLFPGIVNWTTSDSTQLLMQWAKKWI